MKTWARGGRGVWVAAVAVAGVGGCTALLGVDEEYQLGPGGSGGATTSSGSMSSSGSGVPTSSSSASGSSSTNSGSASGSGGATGKVVGDFCPTKNELACAENQKKSKLICGDKNTWESNGTCDGATVCDTTGDPGTCKSVLPECAAASPGDVVCAGTKRVTCGPDLVTSVEVEACAGACLAGQCVACGPGSKQCAGNLPQLCDANGAWTNEAACSTQMPVCIAGACGVPPSCSSLPTTCGPSSNESCCAITAVPGGTYNRSNDASYPATVSDFRLDRFEITVGRFRQFVTSYAGNNLAVGAGAHPKIPGSGWQSGWNGSLAVDQAALKTAVKCNSTYQRWSDQPAGNEYKPMNCLDWYEAFAFCAWDGGRLPTEAEWNYAAAGGSEQRLYPWGAVAPDKAHAVYDCTGDGSAAGSCAVTDILNGGSKSPVGDGRWGQADLAGSVWEWNLDWYGDPYVKPCGDCAIVSKGAAANRVFRGGSWIFFASGLLSSARNGFVPTSLGYDVGARCARTP
jgi:formylglycine-generating enzyme required for sulfatase activity